MPLPKRQIRQLTRLEKDWWQWYNPNKASEEYEEYASECLAESYWEVEAEWTVSQKEDAEARWEGSRGREIQLKHGRKRWKHLPRPTVGKDSRRVTETYSRL